MKIAILSDIHGNDVAFEAVVEDMKPFNVNCIVFLGDLVAKGPQPMECYNRMVELKPLVWLKGNTEYWLDDAMTDILPNSPENVVLLEYYDYMVKHMDGKSMDHLIGLKDKASLQLGHFEGECCHGTPRDPEEVLDPINENDGICLKINGINASFVLSGHSHMQYDTVYRGVRMINPGAIGAPLSGEEGMAKYAIMEVDSSFKVTLRDVPYSNDKLQEVIDERNFPKSGKIISRIA